MVAPNVNGRLHLTVVHQNPTAYLVLKGDKKKNFFLIFYVFYLILHSDYREAPEIYNTEKWLLQKLFLDMLNIFRVDFYSGSSFILLPSFHYLQLQRKKLRLLGIS